MMFDVVEGGAFPELLVPGSWGFPPRARLGLPGAVRRVVAGAKTVRCAKEADRSPLREHCLLFATMMRHVACGVHGIQTPYASATLAAESRAVGALDAPSNTISRA
jgi:hypothetical protein